jgi:hypothetical protein
MFSLKLKLEYYIYYIKWLIKDIERISHHPIYKYAQRISMESRQKNRAHYFRTLLHESHSLIKINNKLILFLTKVVGLLIQCHGKVLRLLRCLKVLLIRSLLLHSSKVPGSSLILLVMLNLPRLVRTNLLLLLRLVVYINVRAVLLEVVIVKTRVCMLTYADEC